MSVGLGKDKMPESFNVLETVLEGLAIPEDESAKRQQSQVVAATILTEQGARKKVTDHDPLVECTARFTDSLHAGLRPSLENYLAEAALPYRDRLLELLLRAELTALSQSDDPLFLFRQQYHERFPGQRPLVNRIFGELESQQADRSKSLRTETAGETLGQPAVAVPQVQPETSGDTKSRLGRFVLIRELGAGTSGKVFLARDPKLGRDVAIKIPHPNQVRSQQAIDRFLRTTQAAAQLRHNNICPIYEINDIPGQDFLVMAFIQGKPLSFYLLGHRQLPMRQAVQIAKTLAIAMDEAHQKGIIHRDLKPDNIQIDSERRQPVIMDFGTAHFELGEGPSLTHHGELMGTPYYMSPEQALGDVAQIGPATDIYALGVILYQMLSGQLPITGKTVGEVLRNVHQQIPIDPREHRSEISSELSDICLKAIAKSPADRFATMGDFAKVLLPIMRQLK